MPGIDNLASTYPVYGTKDPSVASASIIVFKLCTFSFNFSTNNSDRADNCTSLSINAKYGFPSICTFVSFAGPISLALDPDCDISVGP